MKRVTKITLLLNFFVLTMACQKDTTVCDFNIEIRDFDGSNGYSLTYKINKDIFFFKKQTVRYIKKRIYK